MAKKKGRPATTDIDAIRHKDKRAEHPDRGTPRLRRRRRGDAEDDALPPRPVARPATRLEGQGRTGPAGPLEVDVVPIYIQEKSSSPASSSRPSAPEADQARQQRLPARLLRRLQRARLRQKIDFYQHDQNWANRMILGELAAGHDQPGREGRAQGQGPDDLHRPALRHQVRLELAGQHAKTRRQGRQDRRTRLASPNRFGHSETHGKLAFILI